MAIPETNSLDVSRPVGDAAPLAVAPGSAVWLVWMRDLIDGDQLLLKPAYASREACVKRVKRLNDRETDSFSYGYQRIPIVGRPNTNVQRRSGDEPASPSVLQPADQPPTPERSL